MIDRHKSVVTLQVPHKSVGKMKGRDVSVQFCELQKLLVSTYLGTLESTYTRQLRCNVTNTVVNVRLVRLSRTSTGRCSSNESISQSPKAWRRSAIDFQRSPPQLNVTIVYGRHERPCMDSYII